MDAVRNWGYWLSSFGIAGVAVAPHDLLVIDSEISADRTFEREITPADLLANSLDNAFAGEDRVDVP